MAILWNAELSITLFLQGLGAWLTTPMQLLSMLGTEQFFMLVMPALFWCLDAGLGLRIGTMLLFGNALNGFLKEALHTPRPFWYSDQVRPLSMETTFGMPSGHSQNAAGIWGLLAALVRRRIVWIILLLVIFGIGVSRIYLGMHFTSDVIVGWSLGFLAVYAFVRLDKPVSTWITRQSARSLAILSVISSLTILILHYLALWIKGAWVMPFSWVVRANPNFPLIGEDPFSAAGQVTIAGVWLGMTLGALWLWRSGGFDAHGSARQKLARYLLGGAGILVLYVGLGKLLPNGEEPIALVFRYVRYALVGGWVSAGAPWVFFRLHLATRKMPKPAASPEEMIEPAPAG